MNQSFKSSQEINLKIYFDIRKNSISLLIFYQHHHFIILLKVSTLEENRLKLMVVDYNPALFNEIYQKTEGLRRTLAAGIDSRRFGVDYQEILSWFSVKFIYAYNKYYPKHKKKPEILKAHMIRAMQFMKCRILRAAYTVKFSQEIISFDGTAHDESHDPYQPTQFEFYSDKLRRYMKSNLSDNAYLLFSLQLNPPPYIMNRLTEKGQHDIHKIPDDLIAEYFDLGFSNRTYIYLESLKREIKQYVLSAKVYFSNERRSVA